VDVERLLELSEDVVRGRLGYLVGRFLARTRALAVDAEPARELGDPGPEGVVLPQRVQLLVDTREDLLVDVLGIVLGQAEGLDADRVDVARKTVDELPPGVLVARATPRYEFGVGSLGAQWL
jgi:hypothetical protein